jgi:hypothetical protein
MGGLVCRFTGESFIIGCSSFLPFSTHGSLPDYCLRSRPGCHRLTHSTLDILQDFQADLCIRAGYSALWHIADFFNVSFNPAPTPDDPLNLTCGEFEAAFEQLLNNNVPVKPDCDQAWWDFAGWRVNYDEVLLSLVKMTMAPPTP